MAIPIYNPGTGVTQTVTEFTNQSSLSISHRYSYNPRVIIVNDTGDVIWGDIRYLSNAVSITFVIPISGYVYLS